MLSKPSEEQKQRVRQMARSGAIPADIAVQLEIPLKRLRKKFQRELQQGDAEGKQQALDKLRDSAMSGKNISALIFWVKARCGWRDTGPAENSASAVSHPFVVTVCPDEPNQ
jgi:hypothetical protein